MTRACANGPDDRYVPVSLLDCRVVAGELPKTRVACRPPGRSLRDRSLAFALSAAINSSTGSSAPLPHEPPLPHQASPAPPQRPGSSSLNGVLGTIVTSTALPFT